MPESELDKLRSIDVHSLTVGDIMTIRNPILKKAVLEVLNSMANRPEHTSHATHSNHYKTIAVIPEVEGLEGDRR
jgi:hypothetical protein